MTKIDIYVCAIDRQIIVNTKWSNSKYHYIKIGDVVIENNNTLINEVNMLNEADVDTWALKGRISRWQKFKIRIQYILQIWRKTK